MRNLLVERESIHYTLFSYPDNQYSRDFIPRESVHVKEGHCHDDQVKDFTLKIIHMILSLYK